MLTGQFLRHLREDKGVSQLEWACMFGVSDSYVGRIERTKEIEVDTTFLNYAHSIQMKYDSEVLGAILNGLIDYKIRRKQMLEAVKTISGISLTSLALHCAPNM